MFLESTFKGITYLTNGGSITPMSDFVYTLFIKGIDSIFDIDKDVLNSFKELDKLLIPHQKNGMR